jgi:CRP-like cAMP-binding protein
MSLSEDGGQALLASCEGLPIETFAAGAVLLPEGPNLGRMFILRSGEVEVVRGDTQISEQTEPGAIFGELAALLGTGHTATVRALTEVTAYRIDDAGRFLREHPELSHAVALVLARRLVDATSYLVDVKRQFADHADHFGLVDEVLEALAHRQAPSPKAGSSLKDDPRL